MEMMINDHCDEGVITLVGTIARRLLGNRNELQNGGKWIGELELLRGASLLLLEYREASADAPKHSNSLVQHWVPFSGHMYKVNADGAIDFSIWMEMIHCFLE